MLYRLGTLIVNGKVDPRYENDAGIVCIFGQWCTVYASAAYSEDDGKVRLIDCVVSTMDLGVEGQHLRDELERLAIETVDNCYRSIQEETFRPQKKIQMPSSGHILNVPVSVKSLLCNLIAEMQRSDGTNKILGDILSNYVDKVDDQEFAQTVRDITTGLKKSLKEFDWEWETICSTLADSIDPLDVVKEYNRLKGEDKK